MNGIPMAKNQVLSLKVTSIIENKKQIVKSGDTWFRHDICLEDKAGNKSVKEYLTPQPGCTGFIPGVWQFVKCLYPNDKGDEIVPTEDRLAGSRLAQAKQIANSLPAGTSEGQPQKEKEPKNCFSVKLTGESITFAFAWAKDLMVAEIAQRKKGSVVNEEEDLAKIARMADVINNNICERISF